MPMRLHVGEATYRDGVDISSAEFYRVQRRHAGRTTTSAPTPGDFLDAFKSVSETASSALCVTVSEVFSSTRTSAETAKAQLALVNPDFEIRVVDSHSAAGGQGLVAWEALNAASYGSIGEVESVALAVRERVHLLAYVDTLFYLWKSGRVPAIAHMGVSILNLKPLFELRMSEVIRLGRPRTTEQAMSRMADQMADRVDGSRGSRDRDARSIGGARAGARERSQGPVRLLGAVRQRVHAGDGGAHRAGDGGGGVLGGAGVGMARPAGFEPATPGSEDQCSVH